MEYQSTQRIQERRRPRSSGFTLIELLVTLAIMAIFFGMVLPEMRMTIERQKLVGAAREIATVMRQARLEAIKSNRATAVSVDIHPSRREILSFVDDDDDAVFDAGERILMHSTLKAGVFFSGPSGSAIEDVVDGLEKTGTIGVARFNADGSVDAVGAVRYADRRGNYLEVRVEPISVARVKVKKWDGSNWYSRDEAPDSWEWY